MATTAAPTIPPHPAKWSRALLPEIGEILTAEFPPDRDDPTNPRILDPFAGRGLCDLESTWPWADWSGVELEREWAAAHPGIVHASVLDMPWDRPTFDALVTSPCFGNRMADSHDAKDACGACSGSGRRPTMGGGDNAEACRNCKGSGLSDRITYRHKLGRPLTDGSAAGMQWGREYRDFHMAAWAATLAALKPRALIVVNVANHLRGGIEQRVVEWHLTAWFQLGATLDHVRHVGTRKARKGSNREQRIDGEKLLVLRAPDKAGML